MKKYLIPIFLTMNLLFVIPAWAELPNGNFGLNVAAENAKYTNSGKPVDTVESLTGKVINAFLSVLAIFFFALMLYGGIRWMTARGNEEFVLKAKNIIEAAIIGLVIILASRSLAQLILNLVNK